MTPNTSTASLRTWSSAARQVDVPSPHIVAIAATWQRKRRGIIMRSWFLPAGWLGVGDRLNVWSWISVVLPVAHWLLARPHPARSMCVDPSDARDRRTWAGDAVWDPPRWN